MCEYATGAAEIALMPEWRARPVGIRFAHR
jgi:hypothetical protein